MRYCIIGAGASGLAVVKNFKERGIPFDCFEQEADIGGIWNDASPHRVYETTHLNTSKRMSRYTDFPMPDAFPQFLSRRQARDYIHSYADNFGLRDCITFGARVEKVEEAPEGWKVTIAGESVPRAYAGVVIANGHHWDPKWPDYPGTFAGECLHAHDVKERSQLAGKRVLVVGAGNTGCDLAADAAHVARSVSHSMRRSYYFLPKFVFGRPIDVIIDLTQRWPLPRRFLRWIYATGLKFVVGSHQHYGLPEPDHKLLECHPSSAAAWLDHVAHGRIATKPDISELTPKGARFTDGTETEADLLIYATGYKLSFPFMDRQYFVDEQDHSKLFLHIFDRERDDIFAVGLAQPADGGFWQLADYEGKLVASYIVARAREAPVADWFCKHKRTARPTIDHGLVYIDSLRHRFEVQHYRYRSEIKSMLGKFGDMASRPFPRADDEGGAASQSRPELRMAS